MGPVGFILLIERSIRALFALVTLFMSKYNEHNKQRVRDEIDDLEQKKIKGNLSDADIIAAAHRLRDKIRKFIPK